MGLLGHMVVLFLVFKGISILFSIVAISLWQKATQHCQAIFLKLKKKRNSVKWCSQNSQPAVQLQSTRSEVYCVSPLHSIQDPGISSTMWHTMHKQDRLWEDTFNPGKQEKDTDCFCGEFSQNQPFWTDRSMLSKERPSLCLSLFKLL